jgi:hypothetical protein
VLLSVSFHQECDQFIQNSSSLFATMQHHEALFHLETIRAISLWQRASLPSHTSSDAAHPSSGSDRFDAARMALETAQATAQLMLQQDASNPIAIRCVGTLSANQ